MLACTVKLESNNALGIPLNWELVRKRKREETGSKRQGGYQLEINRNFQNNTRRKPANPIKASHPKKKFKKENEPRTIGEKNNLHKTMPKEDVNE